MSTEFNAEDVPPDHLALPAPAVAILVAGAVQSYVLVAYKPWARSKHGARDTPADAITHARFGECAPA